MSSPFSKPLLQRTQFCMSEPSPGFNRFNQGLMCGLVEKYGERVKKSGVVQLVFGQQAAGTTKGNNQRAAIVYDFVPVRHRL